MHYLPPCVPPTAFVARIRLLASVYRRSVYRAVMVLGAGIGAALRDRSCRSKCSVFKKAFWQYEQRFILPARNPGGSSSARRGWRGGGGCSRLACGRAENLESRKSGGQTAGKNQVGLIGGTDTGAKTRVWAVWDSRAEYVRVVGGERPWSYVTEHVAYSLFPQSFECSLERSRLARSCGGLSYGRSRVDQDGRGCGCASCIIGGNPAGSLALSAGLAVQGLSLCIHSTQIRES
jgi:hypothetical protein